MTITEFREELDQRIKTAERNYWFRRRQKSNAMLADFWLARLYILQDIKRLASRLNGEI